MTGIFLTALVFIGNITCICDAWTSSQRLSSSPRQSSFNGIVDNSRIHHHHSDCQYLQQHQQQRRRRSPITIFISQSDGHLKEPLEKKAFALQTPHSGRHFYPSHPYYNNRHIRPFRRKRRKRFMEGWYYRLTLVEEQVSFAFIISIEDPGNNESDLKLACIQVVGPDDEYLVQADKDDTKFWAWKYQQGLGCTFEYIPDDDDGDVDKRQLTTALNIEEWHQQVKSGFQILPQHLMGRINGHDGTLGGVLDGQGLEGQCYFNFTIDPVCGWGDMDRTQKSTGGWLSRFQVFEPHWQVTLADARASGQVRWKNTTYTFENEPFYAEKNWGAALPSKWYWTQCNSFEGYTGLKGENPTLSVTAGGGIRKIPFGQQEALGMVSVHYDGKFYEAVPWTGNMGWNVTTWGSWILNGRCIHGDRQFEVEIEYKLDPEATPGLVFRAPTPTDGMVYFCKDTFEADVELTLWELERDATTRTWNRKPGKPLIDAAHSTQGGAEIGGGPWWDTWDNDSRVKQPFKAMLQIPYRARNLWRRTTRKKVNEEEKSLP